MKTAIKFFCAICIALSSMTSCVQGDFYEMYEDDELSAQLLISRNKSSKDGMNLMSILGSGNYPVHVISYYQETGCLLRALNYTLGSAWVDNACSAIASTISAYTNHPQESYRKKAAYLRSMYCNSDGDVDPGLVATTFDDLSVFVSNAGMLGLQETSSFSTGNLVLFKNYSYWGGPSVNHSCCITTITNGGSMFIDNDGNQWDTAFIGKMYTK